MTVPAQFAPPTGQEPRPARPPELRVRHRLWRNALLIIGGAAGLGLVWSHPDRGVADGWYVWAALATLLGVLSGSSFGSGVARLREIGSLGTVRWHRILPPLLAMALVAGAALPLAVVVVDQGVIWQGIAVAGLAILGALPAGAAMVALRVLAIDGLPGPAGAQLAGLIRMRRMLSRLNTIFGSLVVSLTLFTAAQRSLETGDEVPASLVIYTGAASAVVVAMVYMPTAAMLRRRCQRFIDDEFPLEAVSRAELVQAADDRHRLEAILGLHRTSLSELQAGLVIVSPLLASAGITLLPGF